MAEDAVRADVWLWRARFCKTRSLAARLIEEGRFRVTRGGVESRLDKPARPLKPGDALVFALGGHLHAVRIEALGDRRGPASEARALYSSLEPESSSTRRIQITIQGSGDSARPHRDLEES